MANPRIAILNDELTLKRSQVDALDALAADETRDLTDVERTDYDSNLTRMEAIATEIPALVEREARFDAVAAKTATVLGRSSVAYTRPRAPFGLSEMPSHGEQILARMHAAQPGWKIPAGIDVPDLETLTRTLQHGTSSEGISPTTIEGDLIAFVDANRYAVNASRRLPMPDNKAKTFERPRKSGSTSVAIQTSEGDVLASATANVSGDTVTKGTFGGTVSLSEQEIDWTSPEMLGVTIEDLAEQYAIQTDDVLCTAIETASTASVQTVLSLTAASDVFVKAVGAASAIAYGTSKKLPDTLYVAVDRFFYIATLTDGDGRLMFPLSNVVNSAGTNASGVTSFGGLNVLGLNVVPDPNFTSNFWSVAVKQLVESYEQNKGLLQIAAPTTLETILAYRGYFATNVYTQGFGALETS